MKTPRWPLLALLLALQAPLLAAQYPTPACTTYVLHTRDGSTLIGKIASQDSAQVRFETNGGVLTIPRENITELTTAKCQDVRNGSYWYPDAARTRLLLAPTGRMLDQGEAYYQNTYLLLQNFYGGVTDRVTLGGGFAIIPGFSPGDWGYYAMPKIGVYQSPNFNAAVGALAFVPGARTGSNVYGIAYGVGTYGPADGSITAGAGWGYQGSDWSSYPVLMLGGERRVSRRVGLLIENYGFWTTDSRDTCSPGGCVSTTVKDFNVATAYGIRFIGEKLGVDFAFVNVAGNGVSWIFPGIPYIAFSVRF